MLGVRRWTFSAPIQLRAWWETAGKMPACPTGKMPVLQECDVKNWRPEFGVGCWEFGVGRSLLRFNSERGGRRQARCLPAPQARCLCYRNAVSKMGVQRRIGVDFALEFRFDLELDVRSGAHFCACLGPEEIEVPFDRGASAERDLKRLEARIASLDANAFFAVFNDRVVNLQLLLGSDDVIGTKTFEKQIAENAEFPVVAGIID